MFSLEKSVEDKEVKLSMKYFTKQWLDDIRSQPYSSEFHDYLSELIDKGNSFEQAEDLLLKHIEQQRQMNIYSPQQVHWEYLRHYKQIRHSLTEGIRNIADRDSLHDCLIEDIHFCGENLCIKFYENRITTGREMLSSVDLTGYKSDLFFMSKLTFIFAKILKDEISPKIGMKAKTAAWCWCLHSEVYVHQDSYEVHILASTGTNVRDSGLSEIIISFKDVVIEIEER